MLQNTVNLCFQNELRYRTVKVIFVSSKVFGIKTKRGYWGEGNIPMLNNFGDFFWKKMALFVILKITHLDFQSNLKKK